MPGFVPILIGAAILGGAVMLSKKSSAASPSPELYVEPAGSTRPGDIWDISMQSVAHWIGVHHGPDKNGWAVAPAFGATRQEVINKIGGKPAPVVPTAPPTSPPIGPTVEATVMPPWVALTRAEKPSEADSTAEVSPKISTVKVGSEVHVIFRHLNPSVVGEWGTMVKITSGPYIAMEGPGAGVYWNGIIAVESTLPGGPAEGEAVNFKSENIQSISESVGTAGVAGALYSYTPDNPYGHRRPDSPYDPLIWHGYHSPHYPYSPYDPAWWHRRY